MRWLYRVQQRIGVTRAETTSLLFISGLFMLGMGVRYHQMHMVVIPEGIYAEADALFEARTAGIGLPAVAPVDSAAPAAVQEAPQRSSQATPGKMNLNKASAAQLQRLPGIGPRLAERIIAYRQANGPFARVEDLIKVSGIGQKTLERLVPLLFVEEPTE